ncbi:hypothetical protein [Pelagibius sp. Alg239-R121]|uniref:hypothetical protein n=1 Tax=Pelagibius sp. Alg239-R121 TaxID=2993448 RepID=UPI0024A6904B|nr:hypothetical protein [Pelagibius sp. Alg239-R121]
MWKSVTLGLSLAIATTIAATPALAQSQCDSRDKILATLAKKYSEAPVAVGLTSKGGLVEVLSTGDGNTWTIIMSTPDGKSCLVAAGEGWREKEAVALNADPEV